METSNNRKFKDGIIKESYFDTQFKYQDFNEKALCDRFLRWKRNNYIAYAVVNKDFEAIKPSGESFLVSTQTLRNRFDELFPYSFIVADKQFIDNNYLPKEYNGQRRYIYMVDEPLYNNIVKTEHKPRSIEDKSYPGIRIFRNYEALVEFIEERLNGQPIIIIGKEPWAKLRYFIGQLQITYSEDLPTFEDNSANKFPLDKFQSFLNFNAIQEVKHTVTSKVSEQTEDIPTELPEMFSDFIRFSYSSSMQKKAKQAKQKQQIIEENFSYFTFGKCNR